MNPDKIDYERMGEDYFPDHGGIECGLRKIDMPVYVIFRHGFHKRYLSRSAAINNLARVMATKVFQIMNFRIRERDRYDAERQVWITGDLLPKYVKCCERAKRRILRLLAKQREKEKWQREYDEWTSKHDDLMKRRPY